MLDEDSDIDFEEDELFFEQLRQQRLAEVKKPAAQGSLSSQPKKGIIPDNLFKTITQRFRSTVDGKCRADIVVDNYVQRGSEINESLRKGERRYTEDIYCLDKVATPLRNLLPVDFKESFVTVYRQTYRPYEEERSKGYTSTSNKFLPGFGSMKMKIYIPLTTKVLLADISRQTIVENTYEIILPRDTILLPVGKDPKTGIVYFILKDTPSYLLNDILKSIESENIEMF